MGAMDAPKATGHERVTLVSAPESGTGWYRIRGRISDRTASALRAYPFGHTRKSASGDIEVRVKWPFETGLSALAKLLTAERPDAVPTGTPVRVDNSASYLMSEADRATHGQRATEIRRREIDGKQEVLVYEEHSGRKGSYRWVPAGMVHSA